MDKMNDDYGWDCNNTDKKHYLVQINEAIGRAHVRQGRGEIEAPQKSGHTGHHVDKTDMVLVDFDSRFDHVVGNSMIEVTAWSIIQDVAVNALRVLGPVVSAGLEGFPVPGKRTCCRSLAGIVGQ
jgi:hypothetical protein